MDTATSNTSPLERQINEVLGKFNKNELNDNDKANCYDKKKVPHDSMKEYKYYCNEKVKDNDKIVNAAYQQCVKNRLDCNMRAEKLDEKGVSFIPPIPQLKNLASLAKKVSKSAREKKKCEKKEDDKAKLVLISTPVMRRGIPVRSIMSNGMYPNMVREKGLLGPLPSFVNPVLSTPFVPQVVKLVGGDKK